MSWTQDISQRKGAEQVQLDALEKLLNKQVDSAQEFLECEEQIDCQRSVQMDENRIFRTANK